MFLNPGSLYSVALLTGLRERKKRQTRQAIAETAMRLFAERGFEAVTVNEIAEAAGVAKATLFTYFPTKESLVLDAGGLDDDVAKAVAGAAAGAVTPRRAARALPDVHRPRARRRRSPRHWSR